MPKHGFLTPKAIANRIKAKGLQKLRWYCQMCQKQCRDENGFKCHQTSESHLRQMKLFRENPGKYIHSFSSEFKGYFMDVLRRRGRKRIKANTVYQEVVSERNHIHMNATRWVTLSNFVQYLGSEGLAKVDQTEKGWYIEYIDRDPDKLRRQEAILKRQKAELDQEERNQKAIQAQIRRAQQRVGKQQVDEPKPTELKRDDPNAKLGFNLSVAKPSKVTPDKGVDFSALAGASSSSSSTQHKRKRSALDTIREENERRKRRQQELKEREEERKRQDAEDKLIAKRGVPWVQPGLVVKVINKKLAGGKYHKQKGTIQKVERVYVAHVKMKKTGHLLKVDQAQLETVIPAIGKPVKILGGRYRGCRAVMAALDQDSFSVSVKLRSGSDDSSGGKTVDGISFDHVCKLASSGH